MGEAHVHPVHAFYLRFEVISRSFEVKEEGYKHQRNCGQWKIHICNSWSDYSIVERGKDNIFAQNNHLQLDSLNAPPTGGPIAEATPQTPLTKKKDIGEKSHNAV